MRKKFFKELVGSIKEAGRIHRAEVASSREFAFGRGDVKVVHDHLERLLLDGLDSGKPIDVTPDYWAGKKARLAQVRRQK